ncbi:MAG: F0F1 ATP synthase subunit epsilon [Aphanocapsa feldmannii 277cV]|uniref:ATP synthase epsilon chain n=2 Tax=Aphanocapsa feldmannii TaxID=192050 RepID=A0A524RNH7_9CHRO|nr:MAG: F0F1 ATP synthase subunit epsilon [Aphanocapsa feldmannii 277cV]TGH20513.1 MAG: F0F1 ATP synthase subunit epsilon [Aphanocapsa feldmannii 277cI]
MTLTLRVLAPDQNVFDGPADEVILPSTTGQLGVLKDHAPLLSAIDVGVLRLREGSNWSAIALMGGFAEVDANEVTVLVNAAERGADIDAAEAERNLDVARAALVRFEAEPSSAEKLLAQQAVDKARARVQAARGQA